MLLQCPACNAQFNVPDGAIPPAGRTVRCSACKNEWHATIPAPVAPKAAMVQPEEATTVPVDHSFLEELARAAGAPDETVIEAPAEATPEMPPVFQETAAPQAKSVKKPFLFPFPIWPFKLAAPSLALVWLAIAMLAYFPSWLEAPIVGGIYRAFGAVPTDGVVLADVAMQREQEGQRTRYLISGNIVNQEASERMVPGVRVQMIGKDNEVIWSREYDVAKALKPGEIYPFRITNAETSFSHNVAQLTVDVGHPLQMMFR